MAHLGRYPVKCSFMSAFPSWSSRFLGLLDVVFSVDQHRHCVNGGLYHPVRGPHLVQLVLGWRLQLLHLSRVSRRGVCHRRRPSVPFEGRVEAPGEPSCRWVVQHWLVGCPSSHQLVCRAAGIQNER